MGAINVKVVKKEIVSRRNDLIRMKGQSMSNKRLVLNNRIKEWATDSGFIQLNKRPGYIRLSSDGVLQGLSWNWSPFGGHNLITWFRSIWEYPDYLFRPYVTEITDCAPFSYPQDFNRMFAYINAKEDLSFEQKSEMEKRIFLGQFLFVEKNTDEMSLFAEKRILLLLNDHFTMDKLYELIVDYDKKVGLFWQDPMYLNYELYFGNKEKVISRLENRIDFLSEEIKNGTDNDSIKSQLEYYYSIRSILYGKVNELNDYLENCKLQNLNDLNSMIGDKTVFTVG